MVIDFSLWGHCLLAHNTASVFPVTRKKTTGSFQEGAWLSHWETEMCDKAQLEHQGFFRCFDHLGFYSSCSDIVFKALSIIFSLKPQDKWKTVGMKKQHTLWKYVAFKVNTKPI